MPDCEHFEIAVDRRLRGALSKDEENELEAHCANCASCRAYAETARAMQVGLHSLADDARSNVDWDHVERSIEQRLRARMHKLYAGVATGAFAVALGTWGFAPPGEAAVLGLKMGAIVGAVVLARVLFVIREVRSVSRLGRGDELIARHRAMLTKQVRSIRQLRWVALAVFLWTVILAARSVETRYAITYAGLGCIVLGTWLHTLLVVEPRLRRELAELHHEGPR
jgi:anti-sigma factor RsiW